MPATRSVSIHTTNRCWLLISTLWVAPSLAQDSTEIVKPAEALHKVGYAKPGAALAGPTAVQSQLEEDDRLTEPIRRFPALDRVFQSWFDFKSRINEDYGFQFGINYNILYQGLSSPLNEPSDAAVGVLRAYGNWAMLGRNSGNTGSLVWNVDQRHRLGTQLAPAGLAGQAGYIGVTGTLFSDAELVLVDFNWQQLVNNGNSGLIIGRFDPNDYLGILGYANPWTAFSNLAVLFNPSVAFPDNSWGVGGGHWFNDQWYLKGSVNDANGVVTDIAPFQSGAEFFSWGEVGWSPTKNERYTRNVNVAIWHVDPREDLQIDGAEGVTLAANWTTRNNHWMGFFRAGWSQGTAPIYNQTATGGVLHKIRSNADLIGIAVNWGSPPDSTLRDQTTAEIFYRLQFAENVAITPSLQMLYHPSLAPERDISWVFGLRIRVTL